MKITHPKPISWRFLLAGLCLGIFVGLRLPAAAEDLAAEPAGESEAPVIATPIPDQGLALTEGPAQPLKPRVYGRHGHANPTPVAAEPETAPDEIVTEPLIAESPAETGARAEAPRTRPAGGQARIYGYQSFLASPAARAAKHRPTPAAPEPEDGDGAEARTEPMPSGEKTPGPAAATDRGVQLHAGVDRNRVHVDESFTLTLEITAPDLADVAPVKLPELTAFTLINSNHADSRVSQDGRMLGLRTYHFVFLPTGPGSFHAPQLTVAYRGRGHQTESLGIEVEGPRSGFAFQKAGRGDKTPGPHIMAAAPDTSKSRGETDAAFTSNLDRASAYVNQQLTLTVNLSYQTAEGQNVVYTPPVLTGFLVEDLPQAQTEAQVMGVQQRLIEKTYRLALFPIHAGSFTIGAAQAVLSGHGQDKSLTTEPLAVEIKPLPADRELAGDSGGGPVGQFKLAAECAPLQVKTESPARLRVTVSGVGNVRSCPEPRLAADRDCQVYLETIQDHMGTDQGMVQGERVFNYLIVPRAAKRLSLGPVRLRYFDPAAGAWRWAQAPVPAILVTPRPAQETVVPLSGPDHAEQRALHLRPLHGGRAELGRPARAPWAVPWWWGAHLGGLLALLVAAVGRWLYSQSLANPAEVRARRAYVTARHALRIAARLSRHGEVSKFYDSLARMTTEYLAAKFAVPATAISIERLPEFFERAEVPGILQSCFRITLMACEYVRFGAVELPSHDMRSLLRDMGRGLRQFEQFSHRWKRRLPPRPVAVGWLLALGALAWGAGAFGGDAEVGFLRANTEYEQGHYQRALEDYQQTLGLGFMDPDVYYNLGNTYVRLGMIGRAILAYEQTLALAPRDTDARANLEQALTLTIDPQPEERAGSWAGRLAAVYRHFTAGELARAETAAFAAWIAAVILAWFGWLRWRQVRWLPAVAAGLMLGLAAWSSARWLEPSWWQRAVVVAPLAEVRSRPYREAESVFSVHEGTRVTLQREEDEWVEIWIFPGRRGWIQRGALGMIM